MGVGSIPTAGAKIHLKIYSKVRRMVLQLTVNESSKDITGSSPVLGAKFIDPSSNDKAVGRLPINEGLSPSGSTKHRRILTAIVLAVKLSKGSCATT